MKFTRKMLITVKVILLLFSYCTHYRTGPLWRVPFQNQVLNVRILFRHFGRTLWTWERPLRKKVYPKVSGLTAWSENWKWYGSLPLSAVVSLSCESV